MRNKRKLSYRLKDILECIDRVNKFIEGMSVDEFFKDVKTQSAVIFQCSIIGEASRQIQKDFNEFVKKYDHIPWVDLSDFRNRVIHEYIGIDLRVVWNISKNELPKLKRNITKLYNIARKQNNK